MKGLIQLLIVWLTILLILSAVAFGVGYVYGGSGVDRLKKVSGVEVSGIFVYAYKNSKEVNVIVDISPKKKPNSGGYWLFAEEVEGTEGWKPDDVGMGFGYSLTRTYEYTPGVWCKIKDDMAKSVFKVLYMAPEEKEYSEEILRLGEWIEKPIVNVNIGTEPGVLGEEETYKGVSLEGLCRGGMEGEQ